MTTAFSSVCHQSFKRAIALCLFASLQLFLTQDCGAAVVVWSTSSGGNGHGYEVTPSRMNWDSAEAYAVSVGGHLVSITTAAEQGFITSNFLSGANDRAIYWIGLHDSITEGVYQWTTGETFSYSNWNPGEPNNFGDEDYGVINWNYGNLISDPFGTWNDNHINGTFSGHNPGQIRPYFGIVEYSTPEPSRCIVLLAATFAVWVKCSRRRTLR